MRSHRCLRAPGEGRGGEERRGEEEGKGRKRREGARSRAEPPPAGRAPLPGPPARSAPPRLRGPERGAQRGAARPYPHMERSAAPGRLPHFFAGIILYISPARVYTHGKASLYEPANTRDAQTWPRGTIFFSPSLVLSTPFSFYFGL